jgi:glycosyltransferase involved in cell wall biosynthesis
MIMLSVIIPCLNASETLAIQLEALAKQQWDKKWELIVVDNGSIDNSKQIAESYKHRFEYFKIVDASQKKGQPYALNMGVQIASGESVAFCDADDEVGENWLKEIGEALQKYKFVASKMEHYKLSDERSAMLKQNRQQEGLIPYNYVPYLPFAGSGGMGVRKDVHNSIGGFDETMHYCLDTDYSWRVQLTGVDLHFVPGAVIHIKHRDVGFDLFKQARNWGQFNVLLIKKFVPLGMPKPTLKNAFEQWGNVLKLFRKIKNQKHRDRFIWALGYRIGHIIGSLKFRYPAL